MNRYCRRVSFPVWQVLQKRSLHAVRQYPHQMSLSGISFIIMDKELPVGIAGVMPVILSFIPASSRIVFPKTSWYVGILSSFDVFDYLSGFLIELAGSMKCSLVLFSLFKPFAFNCKTMQKLWSGNSFKIFKNFVR